MQLQFEVNISGLYPAVWVAAEHGTILADGRLGYTLPTGEHDVVSPPFWRHTEATTRQPAFRRMCFAALTPEERDAAVARLRGQPQF